MYQYMFLVLFNLNKLWTLMVSKIEKSLYVCVKICRGNMLMRCISMYI